MSEYILNLLPVTEAEKAEFEAIAPDAAACPPTGTPRGTTAGRTTGL